MKGIPVLALLVAIAAAVVGAIALTSDDEGEEQTLTYTEGTEGEEFNVIGGGREPGPGGGFALSIPLEDEGGEEAGVIQASCIIVRKGGDGECTGTADLPEGNLVLHVAGPLEEDVIGAIIGGTGEYEGAYGSFSSELQEDETSIDTFEFTVP